MLSMKSLYSPLSLVFCTSHENINPWHRASGRIIYFLLLNHTVWYFNYFIQAGVLYQRMTSRVVIIGILAISFLTLLVTTSLNSVRRFSYRLFFMAHLAIGASILPLLFFHVRQLRLYALEASALFLVDLIARKMDTVTAFAKITRLPHTRLLKITVPIPPSKVARFAKPGQHVYLSLPSESLPLGKQSPSIHDVLFNPFTVAEVSDSNITLVLRHLNGPTTQALESLVKLSKANPPLNIEGPLGASRCFPNLAEQFDRILLVAGGVGGTFIIPLYRNILDEMEIESRSVDRVTLVWAMRSWAEASWVTSGDATLSFKEGTVKLFITGNPSNDRQHHDEALPVDGSVELDDLHYVDGPGQVTASRKRPDLKKIVNETFKLGKDEKVAIIVCGPAGMARELRAHVSKLKGNRYVWWHDESFGW